MKKNKLNVVSISSLIILGVIGLSGVGFARLVPGGGGSPPPTSEKLGAFFYSTDAGVGGKDYAGGDRSRITDIRNHIAEYQGVLRDKGYDWVLTFEDISSNDELYDAFDLINAYVDDLDAVFIYVWGHGNYDNQKSFVRINWEVGGYQMTSMKFWWELECLDTDKIGFLVDSCFSGDFVTRMERENEPYLAMSSTDEYNPSFGCRYTAEAFFSNSFWVHADLHSDIAIGCFYAAVSMNPGPCPIMYNGFDPYIFF